MTDFARNITTCANCPHRAPDDDCKGPCPCTVDGIPIAAHASSGECPKGLFNVATVKCDRCRADWHATADCPIPDGYEPSPSNATAGGCGCDGSQTRNVERPE